MLLGLVPRITFWSFLVFVQKYCWFVPLFFTPIKLGLCCRVGLPGLPLPDVLEISMYFVFLVISWFIFKSGVRWFGGTAMRFYGSRFTKLWNC